MTFREKVNDAIENGYSMDHGLYISKAWETFKEGAGLFIGLFLLSILISFFLSIVPFIGPFANQLLISPVITLGYAIIAYKINKKENYSFENSFDGFKEFGRIVVVNLITLLAFLIIFLFIGGFSFVAIDLMADGLSGGMILLFIGFFLLAMYMYMSLRWSVLLVYFGKYEAMEAISTSFQLVKQNILGHVLVMILVIIFAIAGTVALLIGLLIAVPFIILLDYHAFEDVTGLLDEEEEEEIGYSKFNPNEDFL